MILTTAIFKPYESKTSHLGSLEICFDHKKSVVVEISDHSLKDGIEIMYGHRLTTNGQPDCLQ